MTVSSPIQVSTQSTTRISTPVASGSSDNAAVSFIVSQTCQALKLMSELTDDAVQLLNQYIKADPGFCHHLRDGGFLTREKTLDNHHVGDNYKEFRELLGNYRSETKNQGAELLPEGRAILDATDKFTMSFVKNVNEPTCNTAFFRQLLEEEVRETTLATANEFIEEKGTNRKNIEDQGPKLKAEVESLASMLEGLENLDDAQETRLAALTTPGQELTPEKQNELAQLQQRKRKLACPQDYKVLTAAVQVMKDSMAVMQVSPDDAKVLSPETKQARLDACEALKDLSGALKDAVSTLKDVRQATRGRDVFDLPEKLSNVQQKIQKALGVVKQRRNEAIEGIHPDQSGRIRSALVKVAVPGSKNDPMTTLMSSLEAHKTTLQTGVYRERIYIKEAIKGLSRASANLPEGKVRDAVSKLQNLFEDLRSRLQAIESKPGHFSAPGGLKDLKIAASAAIAMYRALEGQGVTADAVNEPKTQRDVFDGAMKKVKQTHDDIKAYEIRQRCTEAGAAFRLLRNDSPHIASVGITADVLAQLKDVGMTLQSLVKKATHGVTGLKHKIGLPSFERKKLTDLLESESDSWLTALHWFGLRAKTLAATAKNADKMGSTNTVSKKSPAFTNVSDPRTGSVNALTRAKAELQEAFSLLACRYHETGKKLAALEHTRKEEYHRVQAQLSVMEKDICAPPKEIKRQRKKLDALEKFRSDNLKCWKGFKKAFHQARGAANNAAELTLSQDHLKKAEIGNRCSNIFQEAEAAARTATGTLREITHQDPLIYGPLQRAAIYLVLVMHAQLDQWKELGPELMDALVDKLAQNLAAAIDTREFDRNAFIALINSCHRQHSDGTLQLPRDYRTVLAEQQLQWKTLMGDKGAGELAKSAASATLREVAGLTVDIFVPGGFLGNMWSMCRSALSTVAICNAGLQLVEDLKKSTMPGVPLPTGILSAAKMEALKYAAVSVALTASPTFGNSLINLGVMLRDIRKDGLAHTMDRASNHLGADIMVSSSMTMMGVGVREGIDTALIYMDEAIKGSQHRNALFSDDISRKGTSHEDGIETSGPDITPETSTRSVDDLNVFRSVMRSASERVMDKHGLNKNMLSLVPGLSNIEVAENRMATEHEIEDAENLQKTLIQRLAQAYINKHKPSMPLSEVEEMMRNDLKEAKTEVLNNQRWDKVQTRFTHNNVEYTSTLTPAGQMKAGDDDIFEHSYQNKGVCSSSTKETEHATNLWMSEIAVTDEEGDSRTLFKGLRHGILSPYGVEDDAMRAAGAESKAEEIASAALFAKPDLWERALAGEEVELEIISTSLVTPGSFGKEKEMLEDQMQAWQSLGKQQPLILQVRGPDGELHPVRVRVKVVTFNFPVNEMGLKLGSGIDTSDKYNDVAMNQLIGSDRHSDSQPGGMVGEYLKSNPENRAKVMKLYDQLKEAYNNKAHHKDGGDPYRTARLVNLLAYEIGAVPAMNCKSGKDRTGMLDIEIKRESVMMDQGIPSRKPSHPFSDNERKLYHKVIVHGGNAEVQTSNTGVGGNKVSKNLIFPGLNLSINNNIRDSQIKAEFRGLSRLARS